VVLPEQSTHNSSKLAGHFSDGGRDARIMCSIKISEYIKAVNQTLHDMMLMFILIQMKSEWYIVISTSTNVALYIVVDVTFPVFQVTVS
jgi:hypothetical protein